MILSGLLRLLGLPYRENASGAAPITTINTIRLDNFTAAYGGNTSFNGTPQVDVMITQPIHIYADVMGVSAWVVLFAYPFIMLWLAHADLRLAGVIGMVMGMYVSLFIPSQYMMVGIVCFVLAGAVTAWGLLQKRP